MNLFPKALLVVRNQHPQTIEIIIHLRKLKYNDSSHSHDNMVITSPPPVGKCPVASHSKVESSVQF